MADYDYLDGSNDDGTVLGQTTSAKIAFWGITPVDQPAALTTVLTTITMTASATATTSLYDAMTITGTYGFMNLAQAMTFMKVIQNLQIRSAEMEARLVEAGILAGGTEAPTTTIYDYVGKGGGDDGSILGQDSSEKISFWGITPCDQPGAIAKTSTTSNATVTTTVSTSFTATIEDLVTASAGYGFLSQEDAYSFVSLISHIQTKMGQIETNLVEAGIIAGGTGISTTTSAKLSFLDKGNDDGTILGYATDQKVGFWGTTPVDQPAALTALGFGTIATIEATISTTTTADYGFLGVTASVSGYKFVTLDEGNTVLRAVTNLRTRTLEIESALEEVGLMAAN